MINTRTTRRFLAAAILGICAPIGAAEKCDADPAAAMSGRGWPGLNGSVVNYEYNGFAGFRLSFCNGTLHWLGDKGLFEGITARVQPVVSKVAEGIMSWPTPDGGGDNVVMNFNDGTVFGHLGADASFDLISGPIQCRDTADCQPPEGEPTAPPMIIARMMLNAWKLGYLTPGRAMGALKEPGKTAPADAAGKAELSGRTIAYETPQGTLRMRIDGSTTDVSIGAGQRSTSPTYATRVSDGIYFISWDGQPSGNHVVLNSHDMRVYDQIAADGTRAESIHEVTCLSTGHC